MKSKFHSFCHKVKRGLGNRTSKEITLGSIQSDQNPVSGMELKIPSQSLGWGSTLEF